MVPILYCIYNSRKYDLATYIRVQARNLYERLLFDHMTDYIFRIGVRGQHSKQLQYFCILTGAGHLIKLTKIIKKKQ